MQQALMLALTPFRTRLCLPLAPPPPPGAGPPGPGRSGTSRVPTNCGNACHLMQMAMDHFMKLAVIAKPPGNPLARPAPRQVGDLHRHAAELEAALADARAAAAGGAEDVVEGGRFREVDARLREAEVRRVPCIPYTQYTPRYFLDVTGILQSLTCTHMACRSLDAWGLQREEGGRPAGRCEGR